MSRDIFDGTELLADDVSQWVPTADWSRAFARKLFAEIAVRLVAYGADMVLVLLGMIFLSDHVFSVIAPALLDQTAVWVVLLFGYFTLSWVSPLHATPMQFLLGMRVLHESGEPLSLRDAAIRSATLVALWGLLTAVFKLPFAQSSLIGAVVIAVLIFIPAATAHRQGLHDFLSHAVVVNRRAIRRSEAAQRMREFLTNTEPGSRRHRRPSIYKMIVDAVVLAIPAFAIMTGVEVANQRNMYARVAYAMSKTYALQAAVDLHYESTGRWPGTESDVGLPIRQDYPAGGYYQLEDGGIIRIQFEVRPELKNGSILSVPRLEDGEIRRDCQTEGDIQRRYVPGSCRDPIPSDPQ
jgi:uncharacterized RDD family membrane protein YckC